MNTLISSQEEEPVVETVTEVVESIDAASDDQQPTTN
jgi:hypothetical protein